VFGKNKKDAFKAPLYLQGVRKPESWTPSGFAKHSPYTPNIQFAHSVPILLEGKALFLSDYIKKKW